MCMKSFSMSYFRNFDILLKEFQNISFLNKIIKIFYLLLSQNPIMWAHFQSIISSLFH